jgi:hypothetical protein
MQEDPKQSGTLDYTRLPPRGPFPWAAFIATTGLVAAGHFGALIVTAFYNYGCCSSRSSPGARMVLRWLGFPVLNLTWEFAAIDEGLVPRVLNSLLWGVTVGAVLSLAVARRRSRG